MEFINEQVLDIFTKKPNLIDCENLKPFEKKYKIIYKTKKPKYKLIKKCLKKEPLFNNIDIKKDNKISDKLERDVEIITTNENKNDDNDCIPCNNSYINYFGKNRKNFCLKSYSKQISKKCYFKCQDITLAIIDGAATSQAICGKWGGAGGWIIGGLVQVLGYCVGPFVGGFYGMCLGMCGIKRDDFLKIFAEYRKSFGVEGTQQPQRGIVAGSVF